LGIRDGGRDEKQLRGYDWSTDHVLLLIGDVAEVGYFRSAISGPVCPFENGRRTLSVCQRRPSAVDVVH
jgi:hypothetical protein